MRSADGPFVPSSENLARDIHDCVNYAVEKSSLYFTDDKKRLILDLTIDQSISSIMEYFEIFLDRMKLCRRAAAFLGVEFGLRINDAILL